MMSPEDNLQPTMWIGAMLQFVKWRQKQVERCCLNKLSSLSLASEGTDNDALFKNSYCNQLFLIMTQWGVEST